MRGRAASNLLTGALLLALGAALTLEGRERQAVDQFASDQRAAGVVGGLVEREVDAAPVTPSGRDRAIGEPIEEAAEAGDDGASFDTAQRFGIASPIERTAPLGESIAPVEPVEVIDLIAPADIDDTAEAGDVQVASAATTRDPTNANCGDWRIDGRRLDVLFGDLPGCGADDAIEVRHLSGVAVDPPAQLTCAAASGLATWIEEGVRPAADAAFGEEVVAIGNVSSYVCRTVNRREGGKLSEHAKANALDIAWFRLASGRVIRVEAGWRTPESGPFLNAAWGAACGPMGTVLGPEADAYHHDHFHLDAKKRRTPYCR